MEPSKLKVISDVSVHMHYDDSDAFERRVRAFKVAAKNMTVRGIMGSASQADMEDIIRAAEWMLTGELVDFEKQGASDGGE